MLRTKTHCNNIKEIRKIAGGYEVNFNRSTDFMIKNFDKR